MFGWALGWKKYERSARTTLFDLGDDMQTTDTSKNRTSSKFHPTYTSESSFGCQSRFSIDISGGFRAANAWSKITAIPCFTFYWVLYRNKSTALMKGVPRIYFIFKFGLLFLDTYFSSFPHWPYNCNKASPIILITQTGYSKTRNHSSFIHLS